MITKNQIKYIQSLSQKKLRDTDSVFVAEGPKIVTELLSMPQIIPRAVYGTTEWWSTAQQWRNTAGAEEILESELERISFLKTPNQVLAVFNKPVFVGATGSWQLLLDGIQDPGNLGTIIRIADWFGVKQIICSKDCADAFNPKVIQSTMASIGRVEIMYADLVEFVSMHGHRHFYAATLEGKPLREIKPHGASALVIGNESRGIRPPLMKQLTHFVTIPRVGEAESLNAAVATGIILSHLVA
jgi:TrmH family RNA methyltransferase